VRVRNDLAVAGAPATHDRSSGSAAIRAHGNAARQRIESMLHCQGAPEHQDDASTSYDPGNSRYLRGHDSRDEVCHESAPALGLPASGGMPSRSWRHRLALPRTSSGATTRVSSSARGLLERCPSRARWAPHAGQSRERVFPWRSPKSTLCSLTTAAMAENAGFSRRASRAGDGTRTRDIQLGRLTL
jgi:hypothetical protein